MSKLIVAALDRSVTSGPVLDTARVAAERIGAELRAVHVRDDGVAGVAALAAAAGVTLQIMEGPVASSLIRVLADEAVILGVFGIRREPFGEKPIGAIVLDVVQQTSKPIIAVPPGQGSRKSNPLRRLLIPLDGTREAARAIDRMGGRLAEAGVEILALHVFDAQRVPRFSDQPQHEVEAWMREFLARSFPRPGAQLHTRRGWASAAILEVASEQEADMIALGWRQDLSAGRAAVVRELLSRTTVPILLVPMAQEPAASSADTGARRWS